MTDNSIRRYYKKDFFGNGIMEGKRFYIGDRINGFVRVKDSSDITRFTANYRNGSMNGESVSFLLNGRIKEILSYENGKKSFRILFYDCGLLYSATYYEENELNIVTYYQKDGSLINY
jgi:antitoxin component YwqK of YwqJK toxin-antitoxin module